MKDLESELEKLPLRGPSPQLDDRVYAQRLAQTSNGWNFRTSRSTKWIVAWSLASCLAGFLLGRASNPHAAEEPTEGSRQTRLAATFAFPAERNLFDMTVPAKHFGTQDWIITTITKEKDQ
jgi:hypothetical protein